MSINVTLNPIGGMYTLPFPTYTGYYAGYQMFKLATFLKYYLEENGICVTMTRDVKEDNPSFESRKNKTINSKSNLVITLSVNNEYDNNVMKFSESFVNLEVIFDGTKEVHDTMLGFCNNVKKSIDAYIYSDAISTDNDNLRNCYKFLPSKYYGINDVTINHGFVSDPKITSILINDKALSQIALIEARSICDLLGIRCISNVVDTGKFSFVNSTKVTANNKYYLQIPLSYYSNAINALSKEIDIGFIYPGEYYIVDSYDSAICLAKHADERGLWINTTDAINPAIHSSVDILNDLRKFDITTSHHYYQDDNDASQQTNPLQWNIIPGEYYVEERSVDDGNVIKITTKPHGPGVWINLKEFSFDIGNDSKTLLIFNSAITPRFINSHFTSNSNLEGVSSSFEDFKTLVVPISLINYVYKHPIILNEDVTDVDNSVILFEANGTGYKISDIRNDDAFTFAVPLSYFERITEAYKFEDSDEWSFDMSRFANIMDYSYTRYAYENIIDESTLDYIPINNVYSYIKQLNQNINIDTINLFYKIAPIYKISPTKALCLAMIETNNFTFKGCSNDHTVDTKECVNCKENKSNAKSEYYNYFSCHENPKVTPTFFESEVKGIHALFQHLYAYACTNELPVGVTLFDTSFNRIKRGSAPRWIDLNGTFRKPGVGYGEKILNMHSDMVKNSIQ